MSLNIRCQIVLLLLTSLNMKIAWCAQKEKVAIFEFGGIDQDYGAKQIAENCTIDAFVKQKRFDVVERGELGKVMSELKLQMTGATEQNVIEIGKILGATYGVIGQVTEASYNATEKTSQAMLTKKGDYIPESTSRTAKASVTVQIRMVSVETGKIVFSNSFKKETGFFGDIFSGNEEKSPESIIAGYVKNICEKQLVEKITQTLPLRGYIVSVEDKDVIIDLGEDFGVSTKKLFNVINEDEKTNPKTNEKLKIQKKVGLIEVTDTSENSSTAKIKDGKDNIKEGMIVVSVIEK